MLLIMAVMYLLLFLNPLFLLILEVIAGHAVTYT